MATPEALAAFVSAHYRSGAPRDATSLCAAAASALGGDETSWRARLPEIRASLEEEVSRREWVPQKLPDWCPALSAAATASDEMYRLVMRAGKVVEIARELGPELQDDVRLVLAWARAETRAPRATPDEPEAPPPKKPKTEAPIKTEKPEAPIKPEKPDGPAYASSWKRVAAALRAADDAPALGLVDSLVPRPDGAPRLTTAYRCLRLDGGQFGGEFTMTEGGDGKGPVLAHGACGIAGLMTRCGLGPGPGARWTAEHAADPANRLWVWARRGDVRAVVLVPEALHAAHAADLGRRLPGYEPLTALVACRHLGRARVRDLLGDAGDVFFA